MRLINKPSRPAGMAPHAWRPVTSRRPLLFFYPGKGYLAGVQFVDQAREYAKYRDVLVMPLRFTRRDHGPEDHDFTGGLYDRKTLQPLILAGLRRGMRQQVIRRASEQELRRMREFAGSPHHGKPVVYLGTYFDHYGHLLFESLGRSWILFERGFAPRDGDCDYLFHVAPWCRPSFDCLTPAARALCAALGLDRRNLILSAAPAAYQELIVPRALLTVRFSANVRHGAVLDLISSRLHANAEALEQARAPVWLSRAALVGARRACNERELETRLRRLGFRIVCPERLEFREQIRVFSEHRIFCGMIGSAFHTSLLAPGSSLLFYVTGEPINSNFFLSDGIKGNRSIYCNALRTTADGLEFDIDKIVAALKLCGLTGDEPDQTAWETAAAENAEFVCDVALRELDGSLFLRQQDRVTQLTTAGPRASPLSTGQRPAIRAIYYGGTRDHDTLLVLSLQGHRFAQWRIDTGGTIRSFRTLEAAAASQAVTGSVPLWVRPGT